MHICVGNIVGSGSDNGLSSAQRQAIIWTNAGILSIGPLGTNFSENLIEIHTFSFKKMLLKRSSAKWRPFCLGLDVLTLKQEWPIRVKLCGIIRKQGINSLVPGTFEWNFKAIFMLILVIGGWRISCCIDLRWMSLDLTDDKSTLVQVMVWCH